MLIPMTSLVLQTLLIQMFVSRKSHRRMSRSLIRKLHVNDQVLTTEWISAEVIFHSRFLLLALSLGIPLVMLRSTELIPPKVLRKFTAHSPQREK